ncbi:MAG: 2OG-Fe(II) oxygenase [Bdellovibrionales bacterium]|nr:2OG-Fe(II) oxygenase [Bdellovibrionales bacterium]
MVLDQSTPSIHIVDEFSQQTQELKKHFLNEFSKPLQATQNRFVWDYWHVPDQYTLVRTSAANYFPERSYSRWEEELILWGREHLGCSEISPTWLSYYVDGCEQHWHADNPHGPWAFVFSLTDWSSRKFQGGQTQILSNQVLDYWNGFDSNLGFEMESLIHQIEPEFNRLTVFDPRIPHAVAPVQGVKDPREARIVIHGWFLEPSPELQGGLEGEEVSDVFSDVLGMALDQVEDFGKYNGYISYRLKIATSGVIESVQVVSNTLKAIDENSLELKKVEQILFDVFPNLKFPTAKKESVFTLPLIFK